MSSRALVQRSRHTTHRPFAHLLRLRVWLRRRSLDGRLAGGEDPAASSELARRAGQLASGKTRRQLAAGIDNVVNAAEEPPRSLSAAVPLCRGAVLHARPLLLALADELRPPGPVYAQGVALTRALLCDGASPLYAPCDEQALEQAIEEARSGLRGEGLVD